MAQQATIEAASRDNTGKGIARSLRRAGRIPAVIYGRGRAPEALSVDTTTVTRLLTQVSASTTLVDVAAGTHTIALTASTLSKGSVSVNDTNVDSFDDYVIVNVPLPAADQSSRRFFMLNGVNAMKDFMLPALGTLRVMFIDGDAQFNSGQGTVRLDGTGATATVDATANVLPWNAGCLAINASVSVSDRPHRATLTESTLSTGSGSKDDLVLLRLPSERPMDPMRFVMLNGVGSSVDFCSFAIRIETGGMTAMWVLQQTGLPQSP